MGKLTGKVAFITGASSGIGRELAREFAGQGAHVVLLARRIDRLTTLAQELERLGVEALALPCDVTQDADLTQAAQQTLSRWGRIDFVVANAGFGVQGPFESLRLEDYQRQFETNVYGVIRTIEATLGALKETRGCLVLIGSVAGLVSVPGGSAYCMSKHAITALGRCLRTEFSPFGVSVTLILPGFVDSEIQQVDNRGRFHPKAKRQMPNWLPLSTNVAARQIVRAALARESERIVTFHGMALAALQRFAPWIYPMLFKQLGIAARSEPK